MKKGIIEKIVSIPEGINVEISGRDIIVKKGNKEVKKRFRGEAVTFEKKGNTIVFSCNENKKKYNAIVNTFTVHLQNMFTGVEKGYYYKLKIVHAHFPITVQKKERRLEINNFTGEKKPRVIMIVGATEVEIKGKEIVLKGPSKEDVSQTAANLEQATKVKNRDLRVFQDGIYLIEKGING